MINRPVNTYGLTGLLYTTSPFTIPSKTVELGVGVVTEKSAVPDYTINQIPAVTVTVGLPGNGELALKGSLYQMTLASSARERQIGEDRLTYKWNFRQQTESSHGPALALIVTAVAGNGTHTAVVNNVTVDRNIGDVRHWGTQFGLSGGSEIIVGDHVVGLFADAQMMVHDTTDDDARDKYGIANAGVLVPISKYRNLQMMLEYSIVNGIKRITAQGGDYSAITYGLRLVSERFNLSIGTSFLHKRADGFDNSSKITGMLSLKL